MPDQNLHFLADQAGLDVTWQNYAGATHTVGDDTLRAALAALGLPAATDEQVHDSLAQAQYETASRTPMLITTGLHQPITLIGQPGRFQLTLESGAVIDGIAEAASASHVTLPPIGQAGYHQLEWNGGAIRIAAAPPRAYTLSDASPHAKLWGLAVQLYALRRAGDGGLGDFTALADFARRAAQRGAHAIAISPVHAQFSADLARFSPYAPSNRAALNVLHTALDTPLSEPHGLIDWPRAAAEKLAALRQAFENLQNHEALTAFRRESGPGLENHAVFEALSAAMAAEPTASFDWRDWPAELQNPDSDAVRRFAAQNAGEVAFHAFLQFEADKGLRAAQHAAKSAGMKIGLIADLAVGTDQTGSASWSRPEEVLRGLTIGAPPDLFNREGQNWGITAFSPRGLRQNGFAAFIDMLRHALRHAGGVRIDHVMGLARLWVVPDGLAAADGVYLRMPMDDLLRLIALESQRHAAVILGEDLGTLPLGFHDRLKAAGIAGLRVLWFERDGRNFTPPAQWSGDAVAMTTTHDLPTVAGWWQGRDIAWRETLHLAGDDEAARAADRADLWQAFQTSGAATAPLPPPDDGATAATAACAHLGHAACRLALLPVEDALAATEQPNFPGTTVKHPNWRRRLPGDSETVFNRADVQARLAALNAARETP